jgi:hypothetical protein
VLLPTTILLSTTTLMIVRSIASARSATDHPPRGSRRTQHLRPRARTLSGARTHPAAPGVDSPMIAPYVAAQRVPQAFLRRHRDDGDVVMADNANAAPSRTARVPAPTDAVDAATLRTAWYAELAQRLDAERQRLRALASMRVDVAELERRGILKRVSRTWFVLVNLYKLPVHARLLADGLGRRLVNGTVRTTIRFPTSVQTIR